MIITLITISKIIITILSNIIVIVGININGNQQPVLFKSPQTLMKIENLSPNNNFPILVTFTAIIIISSIFPFEKHVTRFLYYPKENNVRNDSLVVFCLKINLSADSREAPIFKLARYCCHDDDDDDDGDDYDWSLGHMVHVVYDYIG